MTAYIVYRELRNTCERRGPYGIPWWEYQAAPARKYKSVSGVTLVRCRAYHGIISDTIIPYKFRPLPPLL